MPGHKLSDLPGPPAHSAQAAAAHGMAAVVSAAASAKQQQTGSGVPEGKAKEMDPPVKEADAPVFQGLLDSIGALNDSLKKPTSSTKSDDSQAVPGIFQNSIFLQNFYFVKLSTVLRLLLTKDQGTVRQHFNQRISLTCMCSFSTDIFFLRNSISFLNFN